MNEQIRAISVSHERADLEDMEKAKELLGGKIAPRGALDFFTLETCNRFEIYYAVHGDTEPEVQDIIEEIGFYKAVYLEGHDVVRHMASVASGLDSAVLGDGQILGQFKKQYRAANVTSDLMNKYYEKAVHIAEKIREETELNTGTVRISAEAVNQAEETMDLENANIAVIGAGDTAENVFKAAAHRTNGEMYVVNRTESNAQKMVDESRYKAEVFPLEDLKDVIWNSHLVISATSSDEAVITDQNTPDSFDGLFIDLANPRDIDLSDDITIFDLDDINSEVRQSRSKRKEQSKAATAIMEKELVHFSKSLKEEKAGEHIKNIHRKAEEIKEDNIEQAIWQIEEGKEEPKQVLKHFANSIINSILEKPTEEMRKAAREDRIEDMETIANSFKK